LYFQEAKTMEGMVRQHSSRSLQSMTSGQDVSLTYFSHSRPRDPNAALAVQFQESAEAVRLRRLSKQPSASKLEPSMCSQPQFGPARPASHLTSPHLTSPHLTSSLTHSFTVKSFTDTLLDRIQSTPRPSFARPSLASVSSAFRLARKPRRDDAFVDREVRTDAHQVCQCIQYRRVPLSTML
jgi:hypothetical protein